MATQLIVVEDVKQWGFPEIACPVVHIDDYLTSPDYFALKNVQVINLCGDYRYSSVGYYCSLLAEARRHRVIPSVKSMLDLSDKTLYSFDAVILEEDVEKAFKKNGTTDVAKEFELKVMFGSCNEESFRTLARKLFEIFPYPLLQVKFKQLDKWRITTIRPLVLHRLNAEDRLFFSNALSAYLARRWRAPRQRVFGRYDLAILHDPNDPLPPSNPRALKAFIKAGRKLGINVELIERKDYSRLAEYDALFIRDTTRINHYTYRFAKRAESEGMVVMDDPSSILRCTNKVYLAELLRANNIDTPRSVILGRRDMEAAEQAIGYPMVLKVPDSAFSQGVFKAENRQEFEAIAERLFKSSELILAQEYLYTEFDWRIGVLNRKPIFACQYFMFRKHWQIVKHGSSGGFQEGASKTWAVAEAPKAVVDIAVKAAGLIGDGLYGVDVKQSDRGIYVIEVNDNPNLDVGVEDDYLGEELFSLVMTEFLRRLDSRK
jgi:glutathione synthase/RimK-type ligase-like ATP-grasp enzyme